MLFDKKLAGLDFIKDIDIEVKANGKVSDSFADEDTKLR